MAKYFPETILIVGLLLVAGFAYHASHRAYFSVSVEIAPENDIVGTCRYQGRYWMAQRDPNGAFHCFLRDAR